MIKKLFNNPVVVYQSANTDEYSSPEPAICISEDSSGLLVMAQECREILLNIESIPELCAVLTEIYERKFKGITPPIDGAGKKSNDNDGNS